MTYKILIAEDETQLRLALKEKLTKEGYEVIEAVDGDDCLVKGQEHHPNLILLDLLMPNKDGFEVMYSLMPLEWAKNVPIIVLTNLSDMGNQVKAFERGGDVYLVKAETSLEKIVDTIKHKLFQEDQLL